MGATPLEVATGFAVFANGGYKIEPFYIDRIEGPGGQIVYSAEPRTVCAECIAPVKAVSDAERAKNAEISATVVPPTPLAPSARRTVPADAGDFAAGVLPHERHHERRDHARHRATRAGARPGGPARQDRHDQ